MIFRQSFRACGAFGAFRNSIGLRLNPRLKPEGVIRHALPGAGGLGRTNVGPQLLGGLLDGGLLTLQNSSGEREGFVQCHLLGNQLR